MFETIVSNFTMDRVAYVFKKKWIVMVVTGIIFALLGSIIGNMTKYTTYSASISFYMYSNPDYVNDNTITISTAEARSAISLIDGYTFVLKSDTVLNKIIDNYNLPYTVEELSSMISTKVVKDVCIFYVYVSNENAEDAMNIANAIAEVAPSEISRIVKAGGIEVIDYAILPEEPNVYDNTFLFTLLGGLGGFVLVFMIFFLIALLDTTIRKDKEIRAVFDIPILGSVPLINNDKKKKSEFDVLESYSNICTNLLYTGKNEKCPVYVVTSSGQDEGKSLNAVNIAKGQVRMGKKVLIIDADLRKPTVGKLLKAESSIGLSQYLAGIVDDINIKYLESDKMACIVAGDIPPNSVELLGNERFRALIEKMREEFDYIIIDTPPVGIISDAFLFMDYVTAYLVIVRANQTRLDDEKRAIEKFEYNGANIAGFIYNGVNSKGKDYIYKNYKGY